SRGSLVLFGHPRLHSSPAADGRHIAYNYRTRRRFQALVVNPGRSESAQSMPARSGVGATATEAALSGATARAAAALMTASRSRGQGRSERASASRRPLRGEKTGM